MNIAKLALVALTLAAGAAHAGLTFVSSGTGTRTETFNGIAGLPNYAVGTTLSLGGLFADQKGTVTYTYLGNESAYTNQFLTFAGAALLLESNNIGKTVSQQVTTTGALDFKFNEMKNSTNGNVVSYAVNGGFWSTGTSIGLIGTNMKVSSKGKESDSHDSKGGEDSKSKSSSVTYAYVIGFNDHAGSTNSTKGDWDDFVVGVNFTPAVSPVPEPETYAMLLAGLGLMGVIARRRSAK